MNAKRLLLPRASDRTIHSVRLGRFPELLARPKLSLGNFPTRLLRATRLSEELGIDLWIKNEFEADGYGAGNKVRKLEFLLPQLLEDGYSGLVVDGTTQSNCAMALALYAPQFGLTVDLVLYGPTTRSGNYADILHSEARVTHLPDWSPKDIQHAEATIVAKAARQGKQLFVVPTGATNETTAFGGIGLASELATHETQLDLSFDYIIFPTASGGTQAGLEIGKAVLERPWQIIGAGVANDAGYFTEVVQNIANAPLLKPFTDGRVEAVKPYTYMGALGPGYGVPLPGSFDEIRKLRSKHGLILDSVYTYKAFVAMQRLIKLGEIPKGSTVVFIHTGGLNERFVDSAA